MIAAQSAGAAGSVVGALGAARAPAAPIDITGLASAEPDPELSVVGMRLKCPIAASACPLPLSVGKFASMSSSASGKPIPLKRMSTDFASACSFVGKKRQQLIVSHPRPPRWAPTPEAAGGQSRQSQIEFRAMLEQQLLQFAKDCLPGGISGVYEAHVCLKFTLQLMGGTDAQLEDRPTLWAVAVCGNASAGAVPFRMLFVMCAEVAVHHEQGSILRMSRAPVFKARKQLSFGGEVDVGALSLASIGDLAAKVLDTVAMGHGEASTQRVANSRQRDEDVCGDRFRVLGPDESIPPVVVERWQPRAAEAPGAGEYPGHESDDVEWGNTVLPKKKRPTKQPARVPQPRRAAAAEAETILDAVAEAVLGGNFEDILGELGEHACPRPPPPLVFSVGRSARGENWCQAACAASSESSALASSASDSEVWASWKCLRGCRA